MGAREDILAQFKRTNPGVTDAQAEAIVPARVQDLEDYKVGDEILTFSPADGASIRVQKLHVLQQLISDTVGPRGPEGPAGDTIIVGTTIPSRNIGNDGDLYLNEISFNLFEKQSGSWRYLGRIKGDPGMGITPMGEATVAEVNAIVTPEAGDVWIMLDAGEITNGSGGLPMQVVIGDWIGYGETDLNWMNLGQMEGPQGDTGPQGIQGEKGDTGDTGADSTVEGPVGPAGTAATLAAGTTTTGAEGSDASVTAVGTLQDQIFNFVVPVGDTGAQGVQGDTGAVSTVPGPDGPTGPEGPQGVPGTGIYPQGEVTVAEINAFVADPGIGDSYVMADAGTITYGIDDIAVIIDDWIVWAADGSFFNAGPMQGPSGADGTDGTDGAQGDPGTAGNDGNDGAAATIAVGTVTKVGAGGTPSVVNSGTSAAAIFDFGIVTGDTGADGIQGNPGADGADSVVPGPQGETGDTGSIGPDGATGGTGPAGPTAVSADAGNQAELGTDSLLLVKDMVKSVAEVYGVGTDRIGAMVSCTQVEYDLIAATPPADFATTVYLITG